MNTPGIHLVSRARIVRRLEGVNYWRQFRDLLKIWCGNYNFGLTEYYDFRIYQFFGTNPDKAKEYMGKTRQEEVSKALNDRRGVLAAYDKRVLDKLLENTGVRLPHIKASYIPSNTRMTGNGNVLTSEDSLYQFLRDKENYPFFAKASFSRLGMHVLHAIEVNDDTILDHGGSSITIDEFISEKINFKP